MEKIKEEETALNRRGQPENNGKNKDKEGENGESGMVLLIIRMRRKRVIQQQQQQQVDLRIILFVLLFCIINSYSLF
jgi:hypothetical protein